MAFATKSGSANTIDVADSAGNMLNAQGRIAIPKDSKGYERQRELLEREGIIVRDGQLDMNHYGWKPSLDELLWGPGQLHDPDDDDDRKHS